MSKVLITINGKGYLAESDKTVLQVARENNIYIPTLCNLEGIKPQGSCRICTCMIDGKMMTACTTPVNDGMNVVTNTEELENLRCKIVELLFTEGNHFCPSCEKSGNCELQALAYRYKIMIPEFDFIYPTRDIDTSHPKLMIDHNRCILCKRCIRSKKEPENPTWFVFENRGNRVKINFDKEHTADMDDEMAQKAMDTCPVGAIIRKEKGYDVPIGHRKYDHKPIGSDIERKE